LAALAPSVPSIDGFTSVLDLSTVFTINGVSVSFSTAGGISNLVDNTKKVTWASKSNVIGEYSLITLSAEDYITWLKSYSDCPDIYSPSCAWVLSTHGKYNLSEANPEHKVFQPQLSKLWFKKNTDMQSEFVLQMTSDQESYTKYGGAQQFWSHIQISTDDTRAISVNITFSWWKKTSSRLPESHWVTFNPLVADPKSWKMDKLGELVSPLEVVTNGSQNLHGINPLSGIFYSAMDADVVLKSLDIPLVSPGVPNALSAPFVIPDLSKGFHYLLTANIWGTNWPGWYPFIDEDANSQFRFEAVLSSK